MQEVSLYKKVGQSKIKNAISQMRDPAVLRSSDPGHEEKFWKSEKSSIFSRGKPKKDLYSTCQHSH